MNAQDEHPRKPRSVTEIPWQERALAVPAFAGHHGHSVSYCYLLIAEGRLTAVKAGKRTLILPDEHRRYRDSLPRLQSRAVGAKATESDGEVASDPASIPSPSKSRSAADRLGKAAAAGRRRAEG
ncbi:hypothetical protein LJR090_001809 [Bosea sp. LjRoot90]|uniref:hypothetical protein n=1 Tax=Bosea sp. LjRoot90 TaxID=3342342 RepID=UPI003ECC33DF